MAWNDTYVTTTGAGSHDGSTLDNAWSLSEAMAPTTGAQPGDRVNVAPGTYAINADLSTGDAGTDTAAIWWRGYNSSPGDLDGVANSGSRPVFSFTNARLSVADNHHWFHNIDFVGSKDNSLVSAAAESARFFRCTFNNTSTGTSARAAFCGTGYGTTYTQCYFTCAATGGSANYLLGLGQNAFVDSCVFEGSYRGIHVIGGAFRGTHVARCLFIDQAEHAIFCEVEEQHVFDSCTIYSPGSDGIHLTDWAGEVVWITNCYIEGCGGWGIGASAGTPGPISQSMVYVAGCDFYNNTSGNIDTTNLADVVNFVGQTESASALNAPGSEDFTLKSSSNAKANGLPGELEGITSTTAYQDIGAVQRQEPAGGGTSSILAVGRMRGGMQ